MEKKILVVNGVPTMVVADGETSLADVLRGQLGLTGTKVGCGQSQCGCCSVIVNGKVVRSCVTKYSRLDDWAELTTIEGIGTPLHPHPLQVAWMVHGGAQCGFCSPGFIVSAKALLDVDPAPSRADVRAWFQRHRNACRCTGYRPLVDAVMDAARVLRGEMTVDDLAFKIPEDGRIWNTRYPRPTALAKVTGTCDYGHDLILKMPPGTLHLALVQAQISHANIRGIDTSEAQGMPGVHSVLTHRDVRGKNRIFGFLLYPWNKGDGYDRPILCDDKVFQYGDAIAVVCADTEEHARAAAAKVKVDLEPLPAYMDALEAAADDAMQIHPGTPNVYFEQGLKKGAETGGIMAGAAHVAEDSFYVQRQPHLPMEPDVGFAYLDDDGRVTIQSKSISLYTQALMIKEGLGLEADRLRMIQNPMGGSFGYKLSPTMEAILAAAVLATGKPCALRYDYFQQITYTGKRSPVYCDLKMAADAQGKLQAMEWDFLMDHGAYSEFGDLLVIKICRNIGACYDIPNIRGLGRSTFTNHAFGSAFRGYGSPQAEFASEVLMDELAEKVGMDPLEFRYLNVYRPGSTTPTGDELDVHPLPELLDMMRPKYHDAVERARRESTPTRKRGVGITCGTYNVSRDTADAAGADIELNPDGTVTVFNTWEDHGQGADIGSLATAHEALRPLGLTPQQIRLQLNDTATCPNSGPAAASRCQYMVGQAIINAAAQLIEAMRKPDGSYRSHPEMIADALETRYKGTFSTAPLCDNIEPETMQFRPVPTYMYGVFMSEVEVDTQTGKVNVVGMTMHADVGVHANRLAVDGQLLGGLVQGIGLALTEDFEDLGEHTTMIKCGLPYIEDAPDALEVDYIETPRPSGPFGAAGCGELPLTSPHASIINAIYDACGVRITHLPARPDKVLAGLRAQ